MAIILLGLYAGLILLAALAGGTGRDAGSFFVNNRSSGAISVAFSIVVSCVGASATLGMAGMAFALGTPAFWWLGAGVFGLTLLALLLAARARASGALTLPELAGQYLGSSARPLVAALVALAWPAILAAQFSALAQVLGSLTGFAPPVVLLLGFLLVTAHSFGGQAAIMRTDRIQAFILLGALILLLAALSLENPTWPILVSPEAVNKDFPPSRLAYFLVIVGANYLVCPMLFGRLFSAKSAATARRGALMAAGGLVLSAALIVAVGLSCRGLVPPGTPQDAVLTTALELALPAWVQALVLLALVSAIVSSADSALITAATVLSHDLLGRNGPAARRGCLLAMSLAGFCLSLPGKGIIGYLLMAYDIYACGVVAPVFAAMLLHRFGAADTRLACAAVISGGALGLAAALSGQSLFSYAGLALSGGLVVLGCLKEKTKLCPSPGNRI